MKLPLTPIRFLRYAREQFPQKVGVVCGEGRFTYAQFADRAARLAQALRELGAQPGDRIAFLSTNCHRLLEAYYGVLEAGCVLLPLNIRLSPDELAFVINDAQARVLFIDPLFLPLVESFRPSVVSVGFFFVLQGQPRAGWLAPINYDELLSDVSPLECDFTRIEENAVAELFYTSGSSDRPKGVMLTPARTFRHCSRANLPQYARRYVVPVRTAAYDPTVSCERLGYGAHHHPGGRHTRDDSAFQPRGSIPAH